MGTMGHRFTSVSVNAFTDRIHSSFLFNRLIDLSDENVTELKLTNELSAEPDQGDAKDEAATATTEGMAEKATNEKIVRENIVAQVIRTSREHDRCVLSKTSLTLVHSRC